MEIAKVKLSKPIIRNGGSEVIKEVSLYEPNAGQLRGIKLIDVVMMDASAFELLLPRIMKPLLTKQEFRKLPMGDLMEIMYKVSNFLKGEEEEPSAQFSDADADADLEEAEGEKKKS